MKFKLLLGLLIVTALLNTASAVPFSVQVSVNGVDPSEDTAVMKAGEAADVTVDVAVTSPNVEITGIEFESSPSVMAGVLEVFVEKRVEFPHKLEAMHDVNSYELPGLVPAGDYDVTARISYSGDYRGTYEYNAKVRVENEGILSMILGLLIRFLPKFVVKPIVGLAM